MSNFVKILTVLKLYSIPISILKIIKGHNSVKNVDGTVIRNLRTSADDALYLYKVQNIFDNFEVTKRVRFPYISFMSYGAGSLHIISQGRTQNIRIGGGGGGGIECRWHDVSGASREGGGGGGGG